jgi:hypothetical protein
MGATCGAGTTYRSGEPEFTPVFLRFVLPNLTYSVKITKIYHFEKINQFNEREIPKQSIFPGSDPKLYASCDVISILLSRNFLIEKIEEYSTPSN